MATRIWVTIITLLWLALFLVGCANPNPQPPGLTPIPSLAPGATVTLVPALQGASPAAATSAGATPAAATKPDPVAGQQIFAQNCTPCHGARAEGGLGPALRGSKFIQSSNDQTIFNTLAKGRSGTAMPAWLQANGGSLTETQINNVIAFLRTLQ